MLSISPENIERKDLFKHMLAAIGPRPIALASTIDANGNANLAPFSFFNIFGINPPTLVFSPSRAGRDGKLKDTFLNVMDIKEVVINVVTYSMVYQTNLSSVAFEKNIDEFKKSGFTPIESDLVKPFRVKESPVQIECKVNQVLETGQGGGAGNLVIAEIVKVHIDEKILSDSGFIDTSKLKLVGRMGGNYWTKAFGDALFEVAKPTSKKALGVDQIPIDIRCSKVLTGNDLGKLAMVEQTPDENEIIAEKKSEDIQALFKKNKNNKEMLKKDIHQLAQKYLAKNDVNKAWKTLLILYN